LHHRTLAFATRRTPWVWLPHLLALAAGAALAGPLPVEIDRVLHQQRIAAADLSLYIREVTETEPRVALNLDTPRAPASTIKLLTTIVALDRLGPTYRWQTRAFLGGPLKDGHLKGDLIVQGGGDPSLRPEDLWRLVWEIRARGVDTVEGDLVIDNSAFAPPGTTRDAFDGQGESPYNALPVAFAVNFQVTQIELRRDPGTSRLRTYLMPPLAGVDLIDQVKVVEAPCTAKHHRLGLKVVESGPAASLTLTGSFASQCGQDSIARLILDPVRHAGAAFLALWRQQGGTLTGQVREGARPKGARLVYTHESPELGVAVRDINKWSNNLMTRTLFLTLGMEHAGRPATLDKGREAIRAWLADRGLDFPELFVDNGCGLSREDRISAHSLGRLLDWAYASPTMSELMSSLAIPGVDGTLRRRFRRTPLAGQGHLKTGTLHGATGLAGFVEDGTGHRWVLVSLINNPQLQGWRGKGVENAIVDWIHAGAGTRPPVAAVQGSR
jgi:serine-type D-Ala-D-Ala carboxypeptidase/endopeptidase (penicillin-binding protein 4)